MFAIGKRAPFPRYRSAAFLFATILRCFVVTNRHNDMTSRRIRTINKIVIVERSNIVSVIVTLGEMTIAMNVYIKE